MNKPQLRDEKETVTAEVAAPVHGRRAAFRRALRGVAGAALRLHHYRFVRTRMLHDALNTPRDDGPEDPR